MTMHTNSISILPPTGATLTPNPSLIPSLLDVGIWLILWIVTYWLLLFLLYYIEINGFLIQTDFILLSRC
jgi:hypothetical protein